jgi:hypothetical protein
MSLFHICQTPSCKTVFDVTSQFEDEFEISNITEASVSFLDVETEDVLHSNSIELSTPPTLEDFQNIELNTELGDGIYTVVFTVSTEDNEYSFTETVFFYCNAECCVNKMAVKVSLRCCKNEEFKTYTMAWTLLQSLKVNAGLGNTQNFKEVLSSIDRLCEMEKCRCKK